MAERRHRSNSDSPLDRVLASARLQYGILIVFAFLLYGNTLGHGYVLDDVAVNVKNQLTQQGVRGIPEILSNAFYFGYQGGGRAYRPLALVTYALEVELFGNSPAVSHFIKVLLYAAIGAVVLMLLRRLCEIAVGGDPSSVRRVPFAGALLFLAHPIHTEAVANIKGRDELLCFLGMSGALYLALGFESTRCLRTLLLAGLSYTAALLSKEHAITFIGVLAITLLLVRAPLRRAALQMSMFLALASGFLALRWAVVTRPSSSLPAAVCANNSLELAQDLPVRWTTAVYVLGKYLKLLAFPHPLVYDYSYNQIPLLPRYDLAALVPLLVHLGLAAYAALRIRKRDLVAYGVLFYLVMISIASNLFVLTGVTLAERLLFAPSLGFCLALAVLQVRLAETSRPVSRFLTAALAVVLAAYSLKTIDRNRAWADNFTLASTDAPYGRSSARARLNYGAAQLERSQRPMGAAAREALRRGGIENMNAVLEICPEVIPAREGLAWAYEALGETETALGHYEQLLAKHRTPWLADHMAALYLAVGRAYHRKSEYVRARAALQRAAELRPSSEALSTLAETLRKLREGAASLVRFRSPTGNRLRSAPHS